jgi:hypothetical protein
MWLVKFTKGDLTFVLPFVELDAMVMATARAGAAGYKIKVLRAHP